MTSLDQILGTALGEIEARGHLRRLTPTRLMGEGRLERGNADVIDFSSNDYLGLARLPLLVERACEWAKAMGAGSGASRLVTGTTPEHLALEARIAAFKGTEAALVYATGWQANAGVIAALAKAIPGIAVFTDDLIHASMHQGYRAAGIKPHRFAHNDLAALEAALAEHGRDAPARLILVESVYSMDGDRADLARLSAIAKAHGAFLFVDEAHATGVLGPRGAGLSAALPEGVDVVMGTFSKALGGFGAYVAGSRVLCDYLVNRCAGFIFSTAPPPAVLGAIDAALDLLPEMDTERAHLAALGDDLREQLQALGFATGESSTHIVPAIVGDPRATVALSKALEAEGFLAWPYRPPTVPEGTSRIRFALRATLSHGDIARLAKTLARLK
ncbi:MAG: 8-amino-7-oxononanoate synthase [Sphingomonadaceae bacterium]